MIVSCPSCKTKYQYEESRFGDATVKRLKCTRCETLFEITNPAAEREEPIAGLVPGVAADRTTKHGSKVEEAAAGLPPLPALPVAKRYSLAVIMGANAGQIHILEQPRIVLGRGDENDIQLQDSEVSRRHAMLEIHGDEAVVTDLGSTNGTYVEAMRVQRATIGSNQEFSLGTTTLMFIVTDAHDGITE